MNRVTQFYAAILLLFTIGFSIGISGCTGSDKLSEQVLVQGIATAVSPVQADVPVPTGSSAATANSKPFPGQTPGPEPNMSPAPNNSPMLTSGPVPTVSPAPSAGPKPFPRPSALPEPTGSPVPVPTPTPTPAPTAAADKAYLIEVDVTNQVVSVFEKDNNGNFTQLVRQMICSTGKPSTPTPLGTYTLPGGKYDRGVWGYFSKFNVWARYFVRIKGGYLFHSVIYAKNDVRTLKQSTVDALGTPVSAGCIRLHVEDARWIYDNAKPGTTVKIVKKEKNPELTAALKAGKPAPTPKPPEAVAVSLVVDKRERVELKVGETVPFKAMVTYSDKTEKDETVNAEYSLDKEGIAVIRNNTVQGISPGTTTMTVHFKGITASIEVFVKEAVIPEEIPGSPAGSPDIFGGNLENPEGTSGTSADSPVSLPDP